MLTIEIRQDEKQVGLLMATEKVFKTGSRGYFGIGKLQIGPGVVAVDWLQAWVRSARRNPSGENHELLKQRPETSIEEISGRCLSRLAGKVCFMFRYIPVSARISPVCARWPRMS